MADSAPRRRRASGRRTARQAGYSGARGKPLESQSTKGGGTRTAHTVERVLVIPFADGIGDFVLMLPLLGAVRRRYPNAAVTVAASQRSSLLLDREAQPRVEVRPPSGLSGAPPPARVGALGRLWPQSSLAWLEAVRLRWEFGRFDRVLNLHYWWERGYDFDRHWTPQVPPRDGAPHTLDYLADRLGR